MGPSHIRKLLGAARMKKYVWHKRAHLQEADKKEFFLSSVDFFISHSRSELLYLKIFPLACIIVSSCHKKIRL